MNARPITWPTVPKGKDRVRVCLHAGNTWEEVDRLVDAITEWAENVSEQSHGDTGKEENKETEMAVKVLLESKL